MGGHRYFRSEDIDRFLNDIFALAKQWAGDGKASEPQAEFYCQTIDIFQARLARFERALGAIEALKNIYTLISSVAGEIGNNSFDHNIGNWPDIPGVFFGYDLVRRYAVMADRGQGVLKTLQRVRPTLMSDREAITVAFTEIISARAPQARGNGLKYVRRVVKKQAWTLLFTSGNAELTMTKGNDELMFSESRQQHQGCLVKFTFSPSL